jgi:hypothetical protein
VTTSRHHIRPIEHQDGCTQPEPTSTEFANEPGMLMIRCAECGGRGWKSKRAKPTGSRYRCRSHPAEHVTPKGSGCASCAADKRRRERDHDRDAMTAMLD